MKPKAESEKTTRAAPSLLIPITYTRPGAKATNGIRK